MTAPVRMERYTRLVRSLPGEYYLLREAAAALGVTGRRLRYLMRDHPALKPEHAIMHGKIRVYVYTPAEIERVRAFLHDETRQVPLHSGRLGGCPAFPVLWTVAEYTLRQRGHSRAWRLYRKAAHHDAAGDTAAAEAARAAADQVRAQLKADYDDRLTAVRASQTGPECA